MDIFSTTIVPLASSMTYNGGNSGTQTTTTLRGEPTHHPPSTPVHKKVGGGMSFFADRTASGTTTTTTTTMATTPTRKDRRRRPPPPPVTSSTKITDNRLHHPGSVSMDSYETGEASRDDSNDDEDDDYDDDDDDDSIHDGDDEYKDDKFDGTKYYDRISYSPSLFDVEEASTASSPPPPPPASQKHTTPPRSTISNRLMDHGSHSHDSKTTSSATSTSGTRLGQDRNLHNSINGHRSLTAPPPPPPPPPHPSNSVGNGPLLPGLTNSNNNNNNNRVVQTLQQQLMAKERALEQFEFRIATLEQQVTDRDLTLVQFQEEATTMKRTIQSLQQQQQQQTRSSDETAVVVSTTMSGTKGIGGTVATTTATVDNTRIYLTQERERLIQHVRDLQNQLDMVLPRTAGTSSRTSTGGVVVGSDTDTMINTLREQCLDYSRQLTDLTLQMTQFVTLRGKQSSDHIDDHTVERKSKEEETDDLAVLTDAQNEEIQKLRKEIELLKEDRKVLQEQLVVAGDNQGDSTGQAHSHPATTDVKRVEREYRRKIAKLEHDHKMECSSLQAKLDAKETELIKLQQQQSATGESTQDTASSSERQSRGSMEEDLRKELRSVKSVRDRLQSEFSVMRRNKDQEINELKRKLDDRDTTISALVKASVTLEEQVSAQQSELQALKKESDKSGGAPMIDEVGKLKQTIESYKRNETTLNGQIHRLRKQLQQIKQESTENRAKLDDLSKRTDTSFGRDQSEDVVDSAHYEKQLKERDDAISNLVKQSMVQDRLLGELRDQLVAADQEIEKLKSSRGTVPSLQEIKQLQSEAEVFAGQVIELDEEIESLRNSVTQKECRISELEKELEVAKKSSQGDSNPHHIVQLKAEIDELKEAYDTQQEELRALRRREREYDKNSDAYASLQRDLQRSRDETKNLKERIAELENDKNELRLQMESDRHRHAATVAKLTEDLEAARQANDGSVEELRNQLNEAQHSLESLKNNSGMVDEFELESLRNEVQRLRTNLTTQASALESASSTIRELENMLAQKSSSETAAHEEEKEELLLEIESLSKQLEEAQQKLEKLDMERGIIEDFKEKLECADEARAASEQNIIDSYERKISLLKLDKDVAIEKLRNKLLEEEECRKAELDDANAAIDNYEAEIATLKSQMEKRETRIFALEQTLQAQEQLVRNMQAEMDHLQTSMESAASLRRKSADEMQEELAQLTNTVQKQEREIKSLKMQMEQERLGHETEVNKLNETIKSMEAHASSEHRDAQDLKMELRLQSVKDRLEKLSWRNNSLKDENIALRDRLVKAEAQIQLSEQEKDDVSQLKVIISKQQATIEDLEAELDMIKAPPSTIPSASAKPASLRSESPAPVVSSDQPPSPQERLNLRGLLGRRRSTSRDVGSRSR